MKIKKAKSHQAEDLFDFGKLHDDDGDFDDGIIRTSHAAPVRRYSCYTTHPALPVGNYLVYGGSCGAPIVTNADIYVGLDYSMRRTTTYPWNSIADQPKAQEIYFPIRDGFAPENVNEFKKMITWLAMQLVAGKLIHVGCIGGHGRTGMVLAALVKEVTGEVDAITYVREHYCKKVVESASQVNFLHQHYGIKKVEGSRAGLVPHGAATYPTGAKWDAKTPPQTARGGAKAPTPALPLNQRAEPPSGRFNAPAVASLSSIWGKGIVTFDKRPESVKMLAVSQEGA